MGGHHHHYLRPDRHQSSHSHLGESSGWNVDTVLAIGIALNIAYVIVELAVGLAVGSLALVADAAHSLSDVVGLVLAWIAVRLSRRRPTLRRTYGWRSSTILAALINSLILMAVLGAMAYEAVRRLAQPVEVPGLTVIVVAGIGVLVSGFTALLLRRAARRDLNIRAAWLHKAADAAVSVGVMLAGAVILLTGWSWVDSAVSLAIVVAIVLSNWHLLRESLNLTLHAVPQDIDPVQVQAFLHSLPGVVDVHHLHIWALSTTENALTVHLVCDPPPDDDSLLREISSQLVEKFGIDHATIQVEQAVCEVACGPAPKEP